MVAEGVHGKGVIMVRVRVFMGVHDEGEGVHGEWTSNFVVSPLPYARKRRDSGHRLRLE